MKIGDHVSRAGSPKKNIEEPYLKMCPFAPGHSIPAHSRYPLFTSIRPFQMLPPSYAPASNVPNQTDRHTEKRCIGCAESFEIIHIVLHPILKPSHIMAILFLQAMDQAVNTENNNTAR
jgi:hypothetical protein